MKGLIKSTESYKHTFSVITMSMNRHLYTDALMNFEFLLFYNVVKFIIEIIIEPNWRLS